MIVTCMLSVRCNGNCFLFFFFGSWVPLLVLPLLPLCNPVALPLSNLFKWLDHAVVIGCFYWALKASFSSLSPCNLEEHAGQSKTHLIFSRGVIYIFNCITVEIFSIYFWIKIKLKWIHPGFKINPFSVISAKQRAYV